MGTFEAAEAFRRQTHPLTPSLRAGRGADGDGDVSEVGLEAPTPMDEAELAALLAGHEAAAVGYFTSEIAAEQARAIDYYYGRMDDLPPLDGCSAVVDHSVAVMIDNALAAILKPFVSADEVVSFAPRGPDDVARAEQATDYVNYVVHCDNPGFRILHDWFKDALLTKLGVVKIWWEDRSRVEVRTVTADAAGLLALRESEAYLGEEEAEGGLFAVRLQETISDGRVRIENVPPEEFLVSPLSRGIESAPYAAHRPGHFTRSDLVEMGVAPEVADSLPAAAPGPGEEGRRLARWRDEGGLAAASAGTQDRSRDPVAVIDEYVRVDFDGDGVSELRRVVRVGDVILLNEPVDEAPFALLCPVPMPHKVYGRSVADLAMEGQKVSTAILRQTLDNLYKANNPRPEVPDTAVNESTWDDLADSAPGAAIRTRVPGQMQFFVLPFSADKSFAMLEAIARQTEERTGIQRKGQGFNAEALRRNSADTATQAAIDENSRNERAELVARIFAETGVKRLFRLILKLLVAHQPRARLIRLRGAWVPVDPNGWDPEMDLTISVGLGIGNKAELIEQASTALAVHERLRSSDLGWLVAPEHVHKAVLRLFAAAGIKDGDQYVGDPRTLERPPPRPDPELIKAELQARLRAAEIEAERRIDAAKAERATGEAEHRRRLDHEKALAALALEREKVAAEANLAREKAAFEARLAEAKLSFELALAERRRGDGGEEVTADAADLPENRPGGDLSQ